MRDDKIVVMLTAPTMRRRERERKLREVTEEPEKKDQAAVTGTVTKYGPKVAVFQTSGQLKQGNGITKSKTHLFDQSCTEFPNSDDKGDKVRREKYDVGNIVQMAKIRSQLRQQIPKSRDKPGLLVVPPNHHNLSRSAPNSTRP